MNASRRTRRAPSRPDLLRPALLLLLAVAVYLPVLHAGFIWDDDAHVTGNPLLRSTGGLYRTWFDLGSTQQYYPLVYTSFWIQYQLWRLQPLGYHLVNVLLHALSGILLFRILSRLGLRVAFLVSVIFVIHPINVESVAWVSEHKNVLSGFFYLSSLLAYLRFDGLERTEPGPAVSWRWYGVSLLLFCCALLSKTVTCSLPAVILLLVWWKQGRPAARRITPLLPLFAAGLGMGLLTAWVERRFVGAAGAEWDFSLIERCLIAGRALWHYALKIVVPLKLTFSYPRWSVDAGTWWQYLFPLGFLAVVAALAVLHRRIGRGPLAAVLIFSGTLFPALGFFNTYPMKYSFVADHFAYLASISLIALLVGAGLAFLQPETAPRGSAKSKRPSPRPAAAGFVAPLVFVVLLAPLTWKQGAVYRNNVTLYSDILAKNPASWMAHHNLGREFLARGQLGEARRHFTAALRIKPDSAEIRSGLGTVLGQLGEYDEAIKQLRAALQTAPDDYQAQTNLGIALSATGRLDEAIEHYTRALEINDRASEARSNLAIALFQSGRPEEAVRTFSRVIEDNPRNAPDHFNYALVLDQLGRLDQAIEHYTRAVAIDPTLVDAHYRLGIALMRTNRPDQAVAAFRSALRIAPGRADIRAALDRALAEGQRSPPGPPAGRH